MILDCERYSGACECGREHPLETRMVVVEYGCLNNFDEYMDACGLTDGLSRLFRPVLSRLLPKACRDPEKE